MSVQKKNDEKNYKGIKFTYSVYGENGVYGGNTTIYLHHGSYTDTPLITLDHDCQTLDEAENAIIQCAIDWIDDNA